MFNAARAPTKKIKLTLEQLIEEFKILLTIFGCEFKDIEKREGEQFFADVPEEDKVSCRDKISIMKGKKSGIVYFSYHKDKKVNN